MFDIETPQLVFDTHCHGPTGSFSGYIFGYYEMDAKDVRELFFSHIVEAQMFAIARGAALLMNPKSKPDRMTILDFMLNMQDDSWLPLSHTDTLATRDEYNFNQRERRKRAKARVAAGLSPYPKVYKKRVRGGEL